MTPRFCWNDYQYGPGITVQDIPVLIPEMDCQMLYNVIVKHLYGINEQQKLQPPGVNNLYSEINKFYNFVIIVPSQKSGFL